MEMSPACEYDSVRKLFHGFVPRVMGTKLDAIWLGQDAADARALWTLMCDEAQRLDALLDRFDPMSEISRLNASTDYGQIIPDPAMLPLIRLAETYRIRTGGLFDISRGSCGEGLELSDDGRLSLHGGSLDFGGFAKGFFLRECLELLRSAAVDTAYLDFGGSSIVGLGHHPFGDSWRIRVSHPYTGAVLQDVDLKDAALSTSGNRPGYSGHILDPRSGHPVEAHRIVTVVCPDPLDAEILSTAAMVAEGDDLVFLRNNFQLAVINRFEV